jgi:ribosomal protein L11 methyltransferase
LALTDYIGIELECPPDFREILIAEMDALGAESMMETDQGLEAYFPDNQFHEENLQEIIARYSDTPITYQITKVATRNWNEEWEKHYDPIEIDDRCLVRASFHPASDKVPYEIIINPRMSFGTGHHATTYLMLAYQLEIQHTGKRVLDAGCGTGILAVMAEKRGAREVVAYDNNSWTIENAPENVTLNQCHNIEILEGTIDTLNLAGQFDIILANINKNVLLDEMSAYVSYLSSPGVLILSGFYETDSDDLKQRAINLGLDFRKEAVRNDWAALIFDKK